MAKVSAGLLVHRSHHSELEVFLIHPGGPFWVKKDVGAWSIPKGEIDGNEEPLAAARREFREETGQDIAGQFRPLPTIKQAGGKVIHAWGVEGDCDADTIESNTFEMEWPPKSGRIQSFPEVDRAAWFALGEARERILKSQLPLLDALEQLLS